MGTPEGSDNLSLHFRLKAVETDLHAIKNDTRTNGVKLDELKEMISEFKVNIIDRTDKKIQTHAYECKSGGGSKQKQEVNINQNSNNVFGSIWRFILTGSVGASCFGGIVWLVSTLVKYYGQN
jgi:hypothetical protein